MLPPTFCFALFFSFHVLYLSPHTHTLPLHVPANRCTRMRNKYVMINDNYKISSSTILGTKVIPDLYKTTQLKMNSLTCIKLAGNKRINLRLSLHVGVGGVQPSEPPPLYALKRSFGRADKRNKNAEVSDKQVTPSIHTNR